jgi:hypothetical protein
MYSMQMKSQQIVVPNCLRTKEAKDMLNQEPGLVNIINSCLKVNAADRPTAPELIQVSDPLCVSIKAGSAQLTHCSNCGP